MRKRIHWYDTPTDKSLIEKRNAYVMQLINSGFIQNILRKYWKFDNHEDEQECQQMVLTEILSKDPQKIVEIADRDLGELRAYIASMVVMIVRYAHGGWQAEMDHRKRFRSLSDTCYETIDDIDA